MSQLNLTQANLLPILDSILRERSTYRRMELNALADHFRPLNDQFYLLEHLQRQKAELTDALRRAARLHSSLTTAYIDNERAYDTALRVAFTGMRADEFLKALDTIMANRNEGLSIYSDAQPGPTQSPDENHPDDLEWQVADSATLADDPPPDYAIPTPPATPSADPAPDYLCPNCGSTWPDVHWGACTIIEAAEAIIAMDTA